VEIDREKIGDVLVVRLCGRLDGTWSDSVETALRDAVRSGEHAIELDVAGVDYLSSAGLRVLLGAVRQAKAIGGRFVIVRPGPPVRQVLDLAGLTTMLVAEPTIAPAGGGASGTPTTERFDSERASWRCERIGSGTATRRVVTDEVVDFPPDVFGVGIGSLGSERTPGGEVVAAGGCAIHLPLGGQHRPDYVVARERLQPQAWLESGLVARGEFGWFLRFDPQDDKRSVGLAEIVAALVGVAGGGDCGLVMIAETATLVGASRRAPRPPGDAFAFPAVREWLTFTGDGAFRDTTSLVVGFASDRAGDDGDLLRDLGGDQRGHFHSASYPYRPVRKGRLDLAETARELCDESGASAVTHLLADRRASGAGESEFHRGACWVARLTP
jgi:anti-anti-sigma factor